MMYRKLAALAGVAGKAPKKTEVDIPEDLGEVGLGIKRYLESVEDPLEEELLMMGRHEVPEDKNAALMTNVPAANTAMTPAPVPRVPPPPVGMDPRDMHGTVSTHPTPKLTPVIGTGGDYGASTGAPSATGNKATSNMSFGVKNASFLDDGIVPAAIGGIGGYLVGEHFIAPHFARQQAAISQQIAQGQSALAVAARNQRLSPILAAAAGALLLSWILSDSKKKEVKNSMGGTMEYAGGMQGYNPADQVVFNLDNRIRR